MGFQFINYAVTEEHQMLQDTLRRFLADKLAPIAKELDDKEMIAMDVIKEMWGRPSGLMAATRPIFSSGLKALISFSVNSFRISDMAVRLSFLSLRRSWFPEAFFLQGAWRLSKRQYRD